MGGTAKVFLGCAARRRSLLAGGDLYNPRDGFGISVSRDAGRRTRWPSCRLSSRWWDRGITPASRARDHSRLPWLLAGTRQAVDIASEQPAEAFCGALWGEWVVVVACEPGYWIGGAGFSEIEFKGEKPAMVSHENADGPGGATNTTRSAVSPRLGAGSWRHVVHARLWRTTTRFPRIAAKPARRSDPGCRVGWWGSGNWEQETSRPVSEAGLPVWTASVRPDVDFRHQIGPEGYGPTLPISPGCFWPVPMAAEGLAVWRRRCSGALGCLTGCRMSGCAPLCHYAGE